MKLLLKLAVGTCALAGVATMTVAQNTTTTTTTTTAKPAAAAAAGAATDFPAGPERALAVKTCTQCHVASQVTSQRKTADQWATTVNQMIGFGAQVTDDEFDPLVAYLAKHYGPAN